MREVTDEEFRAAWVQFERLVYRVMRSMRIPVRDEDAWQQARIALFKALRVHDPSRGSKLSTLYYRCLHNALAEYFHSSGYGIQYPRHGYQLNEKPKMPEVVSLNERHTLPHGEEVEWIEAIEDPCDRYEEWIEHEDRRRFVDAILSRLPDDDRKVVRMYYGLDGEAFTLQEIGNMFGITREAARQRVHRILRDLKVMLGVHSDEEVSKCRLRSC